METKQGLKGLLATYFWTTLTVLAAVGWVLNLGKLMLVGGSDGSVVAVRMVGTVIPPLGAFIGWF